MKNIFFCLSLLLLSSLIYAQEVMILDSVFKDKLLNCNTCATFSDGSWGIVDKNKNGKIEVSEVESVIRLYLNPRISIPFDIEYIDTISNLEGIKAFKNLEQLNCEHNKITSLDISGLANLKKIYAWNNQLTTLILAGARNLTDLNFSGNKITSLDLTGLGNLKILWGYGNKITNLNFNENKLLKVIDFSNNLLTKLNVEGLDSLETIYCSHNMITNIEMDKNNNIKSLYCSYNKLKFIEWDKLGLNLISLDVSNNPLENPDSIKFNIYPNLRSLYCASLRLTKLDLTGVESLTDLDCSYNQLTELNINNLHNLKHLSCYHNQLEILNLSALKKLEGIYCNNNKITNLTIHGKITTGLNCSNNLLEILDFSQCKINPIAPFSFNDVDEIIIAHNPLKYINFKNAYKDNFRIDNWNIPQSLKYICCDDDEIETIKDIFTEAEAPSTNIEFNSYCSFTPGGKFYVVKGQAKYGMENSNCQGTDVNAFPNLKFNITGNINSGTLITNSTGTFEIPVQEGSHTITPILEFPDIFSITPTSFKATFPNTTDTIIQNFCITPKVSVSNVIIEIVPVTVARPGFEASYKIIITNKGTKTENGSVNFAYDNNILKFISSSLIPESVNGGIINWKFENLKPFGSIEIIVVLKVNSPMDVPAINAGEIFNLTASILNNKKTINITVVGSYDPNDKTCLQGNQLRTEVIGKYVDYLVRFENTGNYFAENVVIKDIIDTSRFQVNSLEVVNSSHKMVTKINKNVVEFIFENIKLPFPPDDKRHGYVLFKIKTKDNIKLGDSLKNEASIYFDYNFPIKTNRFESIVRNPSSTNNESIIEASIYPNPVKDILTIKSDHIIKSAEIYNVQGKLMEAIINPSENIRLSHLINGTYVIKLHSKDGVYTSRFIKL